MVDSGFKVVDDPTQPAPRGEDPSPEGSATTHDSGQQRDFQPDIPITVISRQVPPLEAHTGAADLESLSVCVGATRVRRPALLLT